MGGERMNRKLLLVVSVLVAATILAGSVGSTLAETTCFDHEYAGMNCVIDVPGKTLIRLVVYGQMEGDYYPMHGYADRVQIQVWTGTAFKTVVGFEDNPVRSAFSFGLGLGTVENVVKQGNIQANRDEDTNTNMFFWNVPLVIPATSNTPAVTLPPGKLFITGFGSLIHSSYPKTAVGPNGWYYSIEADYYKGTASFFCVEWGCKWVSVGSAYAGTSQEPRIIVDRIWSWWHA
jgi:hypothetical protein